jgi:hypothetical protein
MEALASGSGTTFLRKSLLEFAGIDIATVMGRGHSTDARRNPSGPAPLEW